MFQTSSMYHWAQPLSSRPHHSCLQCGRLNLLRVILCSAACGICFHVLALASCAHTNTKDVVYCIGYGYCTGTLGADSSGYRGWQAAVTPTVCWLRGVDGLQDSERNDTTYTCLCVLMYQFFVMVQD